MVVANAVAALSEIQDGNGREVFQINTQYLFKILRALNECTEWGQVGDTFTSRVSLMLYGYHAYPSFLSSSMALQYVYNAGFLLLLQVTHTVPLPFECHARACGQLSGQRLYFLGGMISSLYLLFCLHTYLKAFLTYEDDLSDVCQTYFSPTIAIEAQNFCSTIYFSRGKKGRLSRQKAIPEQF